MRTIVDLPDEQIQALKHLSEQFKLSRAELMRRAVADYLRHHQLNGVEDVFGIWKNHQRDSLDYQHRLRGEWEE